MSELVLHPTNTAQWHALVNEAQSSCELDLEEELESYLVFLLMRFTDRPDMASSVMALKFLESSGSDGRVRADRMRDVGDQCLLYCGLFPSRAIRKRVRISYFVDLGRSAFHDLAERTENSLADLYHSLAFGFVGMMDVLQAMRCLNEQAGLDPALAIDLWRASGSRMARNQVRAACGDNIEPLIPRHRR